MQWGSIKEKLIGSTPNDSPTLACRMYLLILNSIWHILFSFFLIAQQKHCLFFIQVWLEETTTLRSIPITAVEAIAVYNVQGQRISLFCLVLVL